MGPGGCWGLPPCDAPVATEGCVPFFWFMCFWIAVWDGVPGVLKNSSTLACSTSWRTTSTVLGGL